MLLIDFSLGNSSSTIGCSVSSGGTSSTGPVSVVLLEIITVPLLNFGILSRGSSIGNFSLFVVLLVIIRVESPNSCTNETSSAGGESGGPMSSGGSSANAVPQ